MKNRLVRLNANDADEAAKQDDAGRRLLNLAARRRAQMADEANAECSPNLPSPFIELKALRGARS